MHLSHNIFLSLFIIWPLTTILFVRSVAYPPTQLQPISFPPQTPPLFNELRDDQSFLVRLRDGMIRIIWDVPDHKRSNVVNGKPSGPKSNPPSSLLARYGGDVVLRFKIKSASEAAALNEAITVLFLDVWEHTSEWVDIRMPKDVACHAMNCSCLKVC